jgi:hypothetical protein
MLSLPVILNSGNCLTRRVFSAKLEECGWRATLSRLSCGQYRTYVRRVSTMVAVCRDVEEAIVRERDVEIRTTDDHLHNEHDDRPRVPRWGSGVPGPLYRYRNAGILALSAGVATGILTHGWGFLPPWAGFLAGTFATVSASAVIQARNDARRSAHRTAATR